MCVCLPCHSVSDLMDSGGWSNSDKKLNFSKLVDEKGCLCYVISIFGEQSAQVLCVQNGRGVITDFQQASTCRLLRLRNFDGLSTLRAPYLSVSLLCTEAQVVYSGLAGVHVCVCV